MTSEFSILKQLPWIERRGRLKELGRRHPMFRSFRRSAELLRLMLSGLLGFLFYSLRDHIGLYAFLGYVATCWLVEWWFERWVIIPCASLHMEIQKQNKSCEATGDNVPG